MLLGDPPPPPAGKPPEEVCRVCGARLFAGARFCGQCGARMGFTCPACGIRLAPGDHFCTGCGEPARGGAGPRISPWPGVAASSHVERRLATVMFCDMVGSSRLAAALDPEDFAQLLLAYRHFCAVAVRRHGGFIPRFEGDGILACFGYPRALGRDAQSAVACGLEIAREMRGTRLLPHRRDDDPIAVRIGIETGLVLAGRLGEEGMAEADAIVGSAPNVAARLQHLAPPYGVVIGTVAHDLVAQDYACEELLAPEVARLEAGGRAFLVSPHGIATAASSSSARRSRSFVGREEELALLRERWALAVAGHGQVVALSGEPGIGKSRLARRLAEEIADTSHTLLRLLCGPQAAGTTLFPVIEQLRDMLGSVPEAARQDFLAGLFRPDGPDGSQAMALLAEELGLGQGPEGLGPPARRKLLMQALQSWLLGQAREKPLLLLVEDLHWSDPSTLELLQGVAGVIQDRPVLMLVTHRSHFVLPWPPRPATRHLAMAPLQPEEAEALLGQLVEDTRSATRDAILARADGIPLFIEEFAFATSAPAVPGTLQQLFTARLDALGAAKGVAQCLAVIGHEMEADLLGAITGLGEEEIDRHLGLLVDGELLVRSNQAGVSSYGFRHALLAEAAAESVPFVDRRALHARAAALLPQIRPGITTRRPEMLALHHLAAGQHREAADAFRAAAARAHANAALEEAETHARRGLETLGTEAAPQLLLELRLLLGEVLIARRGYANAAVQDAFEEALEAARAVNAETRILPALRGLTSFYQVRGPLSRAGALCDRLVAAAESTGDILMLVDAWRRRGWNRCCRGPLDAAEADLERAVANFDPAREEEHVAVAGDDPHVLGLANLVWLDGARRGPEAAARRAVVAIHAAQASPRPVSACYGLVFAAFGLQNAGRWDEALGIAEQALVLAEKRGIRYWIALSRVMIGRHQAMRQGSPRTGSDTIWQGLASYRETQGELLRPFILSVLAEAKHAMGAAEAAEVAMSEAGDVATELEAEGFLPDLLLRHAQMHPPGSARRLTLLAEAHRLAVAQRADWVAEAAARDIQAG